VIDLEDYFRRLLGLYIVSHIMTDSPLVLSIDIGTSSVRASLYDLETRPLPSAKGRGRYTLQTTPDGGAFLEPEEVLQQTMICIDRVLERAGNEASRIVAVGACTLVANVLGIDESGRAVSPLYTWADTRGLEVVDWLRKQVDEAALHQRTGCLIHTSYLPVRLRWLARVEPELFERVARWLSVDDYLRLRLFGETSSSYSVASWTGLLNRRELGWDAPLLATIDLPEGLLPRLVDRGEAQAGLRPEYARRWPALSQVPWYPALGDGAASSLGSGGTSSQRIVINVGTSAAVRVTVRGAPPAVPYGLWCYRLDSRHSLLGGALSNAGNLYEWLLRTLQLGSPAEIERELAGLAPDGHGLTMLPFLAGERAPGWAAHARGTISGLALHTRPIQILQAALDAIAFRLALIHDLLLPVAPDAHEVVASGGGVIESPSWVQTLADTLNRPVLLATDREASSRGVAISVLEALGHIGRLDEAPAPAFQRRFVPDSDRHKIYRRAMARQSDLYQELVAK
jgi:gluconokinase